VVVGVGVTLMIAVNGGGNSSMGHTPPSQINLHD